MDKESRNKSYLSALHRELIPALGCTEPIAIAYAAAKARDVLGCFPERMELLCSGNIIKNVKGVMVPNSGGLRGVDVAAVLGVVGGDAQRELQVLQGVTPEQIARAQQLLRSGFVTCILAEGVANLYISATVFAGEHSARVTIVNHHKNITEIVKDGEPILQHEAGCSKDDTDWSLWSVREILDFADTVELAPVRELLDRQIDCNSAISKEGLDKPYGAQVGRTLLACCEDSARTRAKARAAAGSDARMGGCSLPVVINSGSGNQGITVTMPVLEYAQTWNASTEDLYRALLVSNLISIYMKHYIGSLSAFCGAVTAACGCGAAITYLSRGDYEAICRTIINTVANVGGIVCDGAKSSCAAKIAASVDAAITAHYMSQNGLGFEPGEGIVKGDIEETIRSVGYMGRVGMKQTDVEILHLMLDQVTL